MALARVLEDEVMDTAEEASDYDAIDNVAVNARYCDDFFGVAGAPRRVLDVGTGTALIPIELCKRSPELRVVAIDMAEHMLAVARRNVARAGLASRVELVRVDGKGTGFAAGSFDAVVSNSIVHHIPEPRAALAEMLRVVGPRGTLFVRDLARPADDSDVRAILEKHAPPPAAPSPLERAQYERQRALFDASLRAALELGEVRSILVELGVPASAARMTSDRHWTIAYRAPARS
jgi:ubiquinone/menaquinone biosynthesis C-methylase UbiE